MNAITIKALNTLLWPIGLIAGAVLYFILTSVFGQTKELREVYWTVFNVLAGGTIIGLTSLVARQLRDDFALGARLLGLVLGIGYNFIIIFAFIRLIIDPNKTIDSFVGDFNNINQFGILLAIAVYGSLSLMQNIRHNQGAWMIYANVSIYFTSFILLVVLTYIFFGDPKKGSWPDDVPILLNKIASLFIPYVFMAVSSFFIYRAQDNQACTIRRSLYYLSISIVLFCIFIISFMAIVGRKQPDIWINDIVNSMKWIAFFTGGIVNAIYQIQEPD
jgi:hypothetical protein